MALNLYTIPKGIQVQLPYAYEKTPGFGSCYKIINLTKLHLPVHCTKTLDIIHIHDNFAGASPALLKCKLLNLLVLS